MRRTTDDDDSDPQPGRTTRRSWPRLRRRNVTLAVGLGVAAAIFGTLTVQWRARRENAVPRQIREFIRETLEDTAGRTPQIAKSKREAVRGVMQRQFHDFLIEVARQEDVRHTGKSDMPVIDRRVDGVYYVEFTYPARVKGEPGSGAKRWLFFMHPADNTFSPLVVTERDWKEDVRNWVVPD